MQCWVSSIVNSEVTMKLVVSLGLRLNFSNNLSKRVSTLEQVWLNSILGHCSCCCCQKTLHWHTLNWWISLQIKTIWTQNFSVNSNNFGPMGLKVCLQLRKFAVKGPGNESFGFSKLCVGKTFQAGMTLKKVIFPNFQLYRSNVPVRSGWYSQRNLFLFPWNIFHCYGTSKSSVFDFLCQDFSSLQEKSGVRIFCVFLPQWV